MIDSRNILWRQFTEKIESEWTKYEKYGADLDSSRSSFALAGDIIDHMTEQLGIHQGLVSTHTLHRYLKGNQFPQKVSVKVLDAFAVYLGYESYEDFKENTELQHEEEEIIQNKRYSKWTLSLSLLGVTLLGAMGIRMHDIQKNSDDIQRFIDEANRAELEAYQTLSDSSEYKLDHYFLSNGTALGQIKGVLSRSRTHRRVLQVPPSSYSLLDFEILKKGKNKLTVITEENWLLRWYDDSLQKELLYDVSNEHVYFLLKEEGEWKIAADVYAGSVREPTTEKLKD